VGDAYHVWVMHEASPGDQTLIFVVLLEATQCGLLIGSTHD